MRKILISSAIVLSLATGGAAFAATKASKAAASAAPIDPKAADCAKQWKAEKKHSQKHKEFMAACEKA